MAVQAVPPHGPKEPATIASITHPLYQRDEYYWWKYRLILEGTERFINQYLFRFSASEEKHEFKERRRISYNPSFAKASIYEIRNSIYQRMNDITRTGGSTVYQRCVAGDNNGVDFLGASMNTFMGVKVLPELLFMGKVGIYVDMQPKQGPTLADNLNVRPYLYTYHIEDIRSWTEDNDSGPEYYSKLLLRDITYEIDTEFGLPTTQVTRYRYYFKGPDGWVYVQMFDEEGVSTKEPIQLNIKEIPFVVIDLGESLLKDTADYQISLMNLASADMLYCRNANFPFYTEQFDPRYEAPHIKSPSSPHGDATVVATGVNSGRRYPLNAERPGFIHPSSEPLKASMAKQEQLKQELRQLLHLALSSLGAKLESAESKDKDRTPLEAGLAYIGLLLEDAERKIGKLWADYENQITPDYPTIKYPSKYSLKTDADRLSEADSLSKKMFNVSSIKYKKALAKRMANVLLSTHISQDELQAIYDEIDAAKVISVDSAMLDKHVAVGIIDPQTAANAMNYPEDTVAKAQEHQATRLAMIAKSQTPGNGLVNGAARGVPDISPTGGSNIEVNAERGNSDSTAATQV